MPWRLRNQYTFLHLPFERICVFNGFQNVIARYTVLALALAADGVVLAPGGHQIRTHPLKTAPNPTRIR